MIVTTGHADVNFPSWNGYDTATYPYLCTWYKIPPTTVAGFLAYLPYCGGWRLIDIMSDCESAQPPVARWPLIFDDTWRYSCLDLDAQLRASCGSSQPVFMLSIDDPGCAARPLAGPLHFDDWEITSAAGQLVPTLPGRYCGVGARNATGAMCPPGFTCAGGSAPPQVCPAGSHCTAGSVTPVACVAPVAKLTYGPVDTFETGAMWGERDNGVVPTQDCTTGVCSVGCWGTLCICACVCVCVRVSVRACVLLARQFSHFYISMCVVSSGTDRGRGAVLFVRCVGVCARVGV